MSIFSRLFGAFKTTPLITEGGGKANDSLPMLGYGRTGFVNLVNNAGSTNDPSTQNVRIRRMPITWSELNGFTADGAYREICDKMVSSALAESPTVIYPDPDGLTQIETVIKGLGAWSKLRRAQSNAERDGVCCLLMVTDEVNVDLSSPLTDLTKVVALQRFRRTEMTPDTWDTDYTSPYFNEPMFIRVQKVNHGSPATKTETRSAYLKAGQKIHRSRLLLFTGVEPSGDLHNTTIGDGWDSFAWPQAELLSEALTLNGVLMRETSRQAAQLNILTRSVDKDGMDPLLTGFGQETFWDKAEELRLKLSSASTIVNMPGQKTERLASVLTGIDALYAYGETALGMYTGFDRQWLTGQPPTGLGNGDKGARMTHGTRVAAYQQEKLEAPILQLLRVVCVSLGLDKGEVSVSFGDPIPATPIERADLRLKHTQADALAVSAGIVPPDFFAKRYETPFWAEDLPALEVDGQPDTETVDRVRAALSEGQPTQTPTTPQDPTQATETVTAEGIPVPVAVEEPKEPFPVGYITGTVELATKVKTGEIDPSQARGIMVGVMGISEEAAQSIAPDRLAPQTPTVQPTPTDTKATDATTYEDAPSLWIGATPTSSVWDERLSEIKQTAKDLFTDFEEDTEPHLTVMYLGSVSGDVVTLAVDEARKSVDRIKSTGDVPELKGTSIRLMDRDDEGRRAIALCVNAWYLYDVKDDLVRSLGEYVDPDAQQFPSWRPHVTLGYITDDRDLEKLERLFAIDVTQILLPVTQITINSKRDQRLISLRAVDAEAKQTKYKIPSGAKGNARKVLRWREEHGDKVKGMLAQGWIRANQLATEETVSREIVGRIAAFARHRSSYEAARNRVQSGESEPWTEPAYVAWLGWGGDTAIEWAAKIVEAERK